MYITSGKLKGRKLANCKIRSIRPAMALVRRSIFDTLQDFITHANILDLCAGSGVIGIEALSRGAGKLTLVDSDKQAIRLINKNLNLCDLKAKVILGKLPEVLNKAGLKNEKFDLIFLDPPYEESLFIENVIEFITLNKQLVNSGLISIESEARSNFLIPRGLKLFKEKRYGNTKVTFLCHE